MKVVGDSMKANSYSEINKDESSNDEQIGDLNSSLSQKQKEREDLRAQMEAFLSSGGNISHIERDVLADPPKKPQSNYGGQPI